MQQPEQERPVSTAGPLGVGASSLWVSGALIFAGGAVAWGCCMFYVALHPGASGEFGGYSVFLAALVDVPVGLASLVVALAVKKSNRVLRWVCAGLSLAALAMPILTRVAWRSHFVPL